jgi:hypothetical protein
MEAFSLKSPLLFQISISKGDHQRRYTGCLCYLTEDTMNVTTIARDTPTSTTQGRFDQADVHLKSSVCF